MSPCDAIGFRDHIEIGLGGGDLPSLVLKMARRYYDENMSVNMIMTMDMNMDTERTRT
jgi:hypothetical protein